jgi:autotransporter-associated beta strand protein
VAGESASIVGGGVSNTGALRGKSGSSLWTGPVTISGNSTRIGTLADSTFEVSGPIGDGVNEYQVIYRPADSPTAILIISGNNTYKGNSTVANGLVQISSFNSVAGGSPSSSLGAPTTALTGIINFGILAGSGNLRYVGPGETTDRTIQIGNGEAVTATGNANIEHNGTGSLVFTAPNFNIPAIANTPRVLTLKGSNTNANRVSGVIQDNTTSGLGSPTISLNKDGAGSWSLEGANSYTGSTTVTAGTLTLGASAVLPDATPVTIVNGTLNASAAGTETAGTLAVSGSAVINLSPGAKLAFADSSGVSWSGTSLDITGSFVSGSSIRFATSNSSLSSGQLAIISINGTQTGNCTLDSDGYLTAPGSVDSTPPVITLNGSSSVSVDWGSTYTDLGATATDETAPANPSVSTGNPVNTAVPGVYTVSYNASDLAGNPATTVTRTVTVSIANPATVGADGLSPLARYAFGANGPAESVQAPVITSTASTLVLTAVVRTNDPKLTVTGQAVDDLAGTWGTGGTVTVTTSANQAGVPANCVRRDFTVSTVGSPRKFLRLSVSLAP